MGLLARRTFPMHGISGMRGHGPSPRSIGGILAGLLAGLAFMAALGEPVLGALATAHPGSSGERGRKVVRARQLPPWQERDFYPDRTRPSAPGALPPDPPQLLAPFASWVPLPPSLEDAPPGPGLASPGPRGPPPA